MMVYSTELCSAVCIGGRMWLQVLSVEASVLLADVDMEPYLVVFDALHGEMIAVVPESTPEHANAISLQLLEHLEDARPRFHSLAGLVCAYL